MLLKIGDEKMDKNNNEEFQDDDDCKLFWMAYLCNNWGFNPS